MKFTDVPEGMSWNEDYDYRHFTLGKSRYTPIEGYPLSAYAKAINIAESKGGKVMTLAQLVKDRIRAPLTHELWHRSYTTCTSEIVYEDREGKLSNLKSLPLLLLTETDNIALQNKSAIVEDEAIVITKDSLEAAINANKYIWLHEKSQQYIPNRFTSAGLLKWKLEAKSVEDFIINMLAILRLNGCSVEEQSKYYIKSGKVTLSYTHNIKGGILDEPKPPRLTFLTASELLNTKDSTLTHLDCQWMNHPARFLVKW